MNPEIMRVDPRGGGASAPTAWPRSARAATTPRSTRALTKIRAAASSDENMMPLLIEAVEAYATVGEICGILREEWGEYQEVLTI